MECTQYMEYNCNINNTKISYKKYVKNKVRK